MKKAKLLATLAAAAVLAVGGGVIAGCGDGHTHTYSEDWTTDSVGHWHVATCDDLKEGDEDYKKDYAEHVWGNDDECDVCKYKKPPVTPSVTEYTVTLNVGTGTLDGSKTLTTVNGKLASLPTPTAAERELTFNGWYTKAEGGDKVTTSTVFDKDVAIYAQWRATDGIYNSAGKLIEALEWIDPSDTATKQYGGTGIELSAGDEFVIKVEGTVLSHAEGTLELWTASGCHGIDFNQSTGKFTVQPGNDRAFEIYAKYYTDGTPCWSIYVSDGLTDELHAGGAYLVGSGWQGSSWDIAAKNYIDPESGLTVTLGADASFKITDCLDVSEGENRGWKYNDAKYYTVKDGATGYLNLANIGASGNGSVLTPGEYKITIEQGATVGDIKFVFTPAAGLEPAPVEDKFVTNGYYLVGEKFDGAAWTVKEGFYVDPTEGLTVTFQKDANFKIVRCSDGSTGAPDWNAAVSYKMAEGKEQGFIDLSGNNKNVRVAGQYKITVDTTGETPLFTITPDANLKPDLTEPVYRYFIKGTAVDIGWTETKTDKYELKETVKGSKIFEMTIDLVEGEFMFYSINEDGSNGSKYIQSDKFIANACVDLSATNIKALAAGSYTFSYNATTEKMTVTFTAASDPTPDPTQTPDA